MVADRARETARDRAMNDIEASISELFRVATTWTKELAARFDAELPPLAFGLLRYVIAHGPVRSADVATSFGLDKASVSRTVRLLRENGLIEATPDPQDGRAALLTATDAAIRALQTFREETRGRYRSLLDGWEDDDLDQLAELLGRLAAALP